jgi:hypothetical protein
LHNWANRLAWVIENREVYYWINTKWFPRISWISKSEGTGNFLCTLYYNRLPRNTWINCIFRLRDK